jgi:glutamyl-tRNA synthetase
LKDLENLNKIRKIIKKITLINAISHKGKAQINPVLGKLLSENTLLKRKIKEIKPLVEDVVKDVNAIAEEKQIDILKKLWPKTLRRKKEKVKEKKLPPLPNIQKYEQIVTRFAPNPNSVLHLGSGRAIVLSHEYAKINQGQFILRFEDTDPRLKRSSLEFFDLIRKDLEWLDCYWDAEFIQSDRLAQGIYYKYALELLTKGFAYICNCEIEEFRNKIRQKIPCPCRSLKSEVNLLRWEAMLSK